MGSAPTPTNRYRPELSRIDLLAEIEDYVKDSIVTDTGDAVLSIIIDLTLQAERDNRPLFSNPIKEPYFYSRFVRRWILEGVEERVKSEEANKKFKAKIMGKK